MSGIAGGVINTNISSPFGVASQFSSIAPGTFFGTSIMDVDVSRVWPVSNEFTPAFISALSCITY